MYLKTDKINQNRGNVKILESKDLLRQKKLEKAIDNLVHLNRIYKDTDAGIHINQSLQSAIKANNILIEARKNIK